MKSQIVKKVIASYALLVVGVALVLFALTINLFVEPEPAVTESLLYFGFLITLIAVLVKLIQLEARVALLREHRDRKNL